jgi:pyruvate-formate lyase-activating enzyme
VLDWIGLDIKAPFAHYARITRIADSGRHALQSAEAVLASAVDHEFRTTIHPSLLSEPDILQLAQTLSGMGVQNYALQLFRARGCRDDRLNAVSMTAYPDTGTVQRVAALFPHFSLRQAE